MIICNISGYLREDLLFSTPTTYQCDMCERSYKYMKNLKAHKKYECGKEPQFSCPFVQCSCKFKLKRNLKAHILLKHKVFWKIKQLVYFCYFFRHILLNWILVSQTFWRIHTKYSEMKKCISFWHIELTSNISNLLQKKWGWN